MNRATTASLNLSALALIVAGGLVHGAWTGRWSASNDLKRRASEIGRVPLKVGDWEGRDLPLDRRTQEAAGIAGYVMRRYASPRGEAVTALLVCGRPGQIAVHTPEVCYAGVGFEPAAPRSRLRVGSGSPPDEFWAADFRSQDAAVPRALRIFYAWSADGAWGAIESPRVGYAGAPTLYKLYVVRELGGAEKGPEADPALAFLGEFLPEVRKALFARP